CQAATLAADLPFIAIFIGLIAVIAGWMVVVPLALLLVFGLLGFLSSRHLMAEADRREVTDVKRHNFLLESIGGIGTVKALGADGLLVRGHERLVEEAADAFGDMARVNEQSQALATELAQAASIIVVVIGAFAVVGGALTIGGLSATTVLTGRLLQPIL